MYKVFINDLPLELVQQAEDITVKNGAVEQFTSPEQLETIVRQLEAGQLPSGVSLVYKDPEEVFRHLQSLCTWVSAAGGLVSNAEGAYLFIFRWDKWDLPKGKVETGEGMEHAALREVEEECGLSGLKIMKPLPPTYHTYLQGGTRFLKKTHWYRMFTDYVGPLVPQQEEGITDVRWLGMDAWPAIFEGTYRSLSEWLQEQLNPRTSQ